MSWIFCPGNTQRKLWFKKIHAAQCSLTHCLQQRGPESTLSVHQQRSGYRRCDTYLQWIWAVDGPNDFHTDWNKSEKNKYHIWPHICGGEGDNRGWDGWMASSIQWTWVWVGSRSWWWTGRPGMLQSMGSQGFGHDWVTELNWCIKQVTNCAAQGTLLNALWRPKWEGHPKKREYVYMHNWLTLLTAETNTTYCN